MKRALPKSVRCRGRAPCRRWCWCCFILRTARLFRGARGRSVCRQGISLGRVLLCAFGFHPDPCLWRAGGFADPAARLSHLPANAAGAALSAASGDAVAAAGVGAVHPRDCAAHGTGFDFRPALSPHRQLSDIRRQSVSGAGVEFVSHALVECARLVCQRGIPAVHPVSALCVGGAGRFAAGDCC